MSIIEELKLRGILNNITNEKKMETIKKGDGVYVGFDPTSDSLHLGNYLQIVALKWFEKYDYKTYAVLGGITAMIGDPSGKNKERKFIDFQEIELNKNSIKKQLKKFNFDVIDNYDFYKDLSLTDFFRQIGKNININYMKNKQIVKSRLKKNGMSFTEFSYQLIQGWDFKKLYETKDIKIQIGGSDQWGNITTGIELIRKNNGSKNKALGITTNLLLDKNGNKFGKSENNPLWINKNKDSPFRIYQYLFNTSDDDIEKYLKILTFLEIEDINSIIKKHFSKPYLRVAQKKLAFEVIKDLYGEKETKICIKISNFLFKDEIDYDSMNEIYKLKKIIPTFEVDSKNIIDILHKINFATSRKEARNLINDQVIKINGDILNDYEDAINFLNDYDSNGKKEKFILIKKGKKKFAFIIYEKILLEKNGKMLLEKNGKMLGETIQFIPHLSNKIIEKIDERYLEILDKNGKNSKFKIYFEKGIFLKKSNRFNEAIKYFDKAIEIDSKDYLVYFNKGFALSELNKYNEAIEYFDKAIEIEPTIYHSYFNKGVSLFNLNNYQEAIKYFDKAIEIDSNNHKFYNNKGVSLAKLNNHQEAIECYDKAIELNPYFAESYSDKGDSLAKLNNHQEAIECYDKAIKLNPINHKFYNNKGSSLAKLNNHQEAIECYNKAIEINFQYWYAYFNKALSLAKLNNHQEAIESYDQAIEINSKDFLIYFNKGISLFNLNKYNESIECFDQAIEINSKDFLIYFNKGIAFEKLKKYQKAIESYDKAIELNPNFVNAYFNKALCLADLNKHQESIECYDQAIEINSKDFLIYFSKGCALANLNKYDESIESFDKGIELNPNNHQIYTYKGIILNELGKHKEAIENFDKAIENNPKYYLAHENKNETLKYLKEKNMH